MSLIFLDIDGVLNAHDWCEEAKSCLFRAECIENFNTILKTCEPVVVISSAWRYMILNGATTFTGFEYMLRTHGVSEKLRVVGHTPSDEEIPLRGDQISDWLKKNASQSPHYVVIDDLDLGISAAGHPFVHTEGKVGLTAVEAERVIAILKGKKDDD